MSDKVNNSVENFQFEPIKGEPRLRWQGKRDFEYTNYFPAQIKEKYGKEKNGWMNKLFWGDNVQVMSHLLKDYRGKIDLIYIDPPFDSEADYKKTIKLKNKKINNDYTSFEEKQYTDIWSNDEYLQFMYERLRLMRELLSDKGSIFLHCDYRKAHHLRCIMDEIFGENMLRNEIIWCYTGPSGAKDNFPRKHDNILFYSKTNEFDFKGDYIPYKSGIHNTGQVFDSTDGDEDKIDELKERGKLVEDWWTDIYPTSRVRSELLGYPTQKPLGLLKRIVRASTEKGDIIFDCFMGSGTTQAVAMKMGRKFLGADINLGAVQTTTSRLERIMSNSKNEEDKYLNFELYNVNNYDIFRNPTEAKELLIKALEINPLTRNNLYDGEKDGRMVKIMPINRIATKADLNDLIANFPYKEFEKRKDKNPNQPVEELLLVCMGHEPDLVANLEKEVNYNLDIEVVDILRDKKELTFKRDSEVDIDINNGILEINNFYPLNLLQKLSLMKENVEEWKELVESILIDWNYNGEYLEPDVIDVPEDDELVKGRYMLPENVGEIRVKITDLLSEVLEVTANNE
ncbi:site-specific DNA-methyltransferase (adenine-specific) [Halanaerobium saccharolyticum]|uniref:Site-specific DNA-methyltransferase (Adenine-specific) n=1 Tax=Halanaerobium saccharolyticum TaxID=43595 RepID=A0A2T5RFN6_9FIRM|nr:site-specific DNA-methyltransferase [Halanaerobium saccharolyticum]PTV93158.1 site-specific DNA-methyltransferase (adenine-specific) [Halanaerobium saccharolyticum]